VPGDDLPVFAQPSLIGFHGQTVWHAPQAGSSVQLGDAQHLANRLGVDVIAELRQADLGAGGQGAPLAPVYHAALLDQAALAAFTVGAVERGLAWSARPVETLVVSGGGVHNRAVMQGLAALRPTDDTRDDRRGNRQGQTWRVISSDDIGAPVDGVEAELVAFLAARCVRGLPTSFPVTTGATKPIVGGRRFVPSTLV